MYQAVAVGALVLIAAVLLFRRRDTGYKVDEFARARSLTTEWARRSGSLSDNPPKPSESATGRDRDTRDDRQA